MMEYIRFVVTDDEGNVLDSVSFELPLDDEQKDGMEALGLYIPQVKS